MQSPRRFAPPAGFLSGASFVEAVADSCALVWGNGTRVPCPDVTLSRALRLVARGTWVELPAAPARGRKGNRLAVAADADPYRGRTAVHTCC